VNATRSQQQLVQPIADSASWAAVAFDPQPLIQPALSPLF
jgi:hypothetical protein